MLIFVYCLCIGIDTRRASQKMRDETRSSTTMATHPPLRAARSPVRSPWRKWRRDTLDELDFLFLLARRRWKSFGARVDVVGVAFRRAHRGSVGVRCGFRVTRAPSETMEMTRMTHAAMRCRAREGVDRMEMFLFGPSRAIAARVSRGGARYTRRDATLPVRRGDALFGVFWHLRNRASTFCDGTRRERNGDGLNRMTDDLISLFSIVSREQ